MRFIKINKSRTDESKIDDSDEFQGPNFVDQKFNLLIKTVFLDLHFFVFYTVSLCVFLKFMENSPVENFALNNSLEVSQNLSELNLLEHPDVFDENNSLNLSLYLILRSLDLDRFKFNLIFQNYNLTPTFIDFTDSTITFKPFDFESAIFFPLRFGQIQEVDIASFLRYVTTYDSSQVDQIKDVFFQSFLESYNFRLNKSLIEVSFYNDKVLDVKYNSDENISAHVHISTENKIDLEQEKISSLKSTLISRNIVNSRNIIIPSSLDLRQGLKIPFNKIFSNPVLKSNYENYLGFKLTKDFFLRYYDDKSRFSLDLSFTSFAKQDLFQDSSLSEIASNMYHEDFFTTSFVKSKFSMFNNDKESLIQNILNFVYNLSYIPDNDFETIRHTLDFALSSGGDCEDRALFIHNAARVFGIECILVIYNVDSNNNHAIAACDFNADVEGFGFDSNGGVTFSKTGKFKPMDGLKPGFFSVPFSFDDQLFVVLKRNGNVVDLHLRH